MKLNARQVTTKMGRLVSTQMNAVLIIVEAMAPVLIQMALITVNVTQATNKRASLALIEMNAMTELATVMEMLFAQTPLVHTLV